MKVFAIPRKLAPFVLITLIAGCDGDTYYQASSKGNAAPEAGRELVDVEWFGPSTDKVTCLKTTSPADRIRILQSYGEYAKTNDLGGGAVEVGHDTTQGFEYWTFYPSMQACIAALPASQAVPSRYE